MTTSYAAKVEYLNKKLYEEVKKEVSRKIPQSYVRNLQILKEYKKKGGKVRYSGQSPSNKSVQKNLKQEHKNKVKREGHGVFDVSVFNEELAAKAVVFDFLSQSLADIKLDFSKFLNPNLNPDLLNPGREKNTYRPMEKDDDGAKRIVNADNEDGLLNNPTPLNKNGGSNTYQGGADKSGQDDGKAMPVVKDDGYTATSDSDDSLDDYIEWVEPLQSQIDELHQCLQNLFLAVNGQSQDFWNYVSRHGQGHLPPIKSAEQMKEILKTLGLDHDYVVQPQTIYASNGSVKGFNIKLTKK
jgi:hypothetical protein